MVFHFWHISHLNGCLLWRYRLQETPNLLWPVFQKLVYAYHKKGIWNTFSWKNKCSIVMVMLISEHCDVLAVSLVLSHYHSCPNYVIVAYVIGVPRNSFFVMACLELSCYWPGFRPSFGLLGNQNHSFPLSFCLWLRRTHSLFKRLF